MELTQVVAVFGRREKCFVTIGGHNPAAKYVVSQDNYYETSCGDHLTRAIAQVMHDAGDTGRLDVTVWSRP